MRRHLVETVDGTLHFRSAGELDIGPVVLLYHQSPSSSRMWTGVMEALERRGIGSLAGDMFDYGMSDLASRQLTVEAHTSALFDAARSLTDHAGVVVGHHTGAVFAAAIAGQRLVDGLMVIGYPLYPTWREKFERLGARIRPDRFGADGAELGELWSKLNTSLEPDTPLSDRHAILVDRLSAGPIWYTAYAALLGADLHGILHGAVESGAPIATVFARDDAISRFEPGVTEVASVEPTWIEGGPWVTIEHPERVAEVVESFVAGLR